MHICFHLPGTEKKGVLEWKCGKDDLVVGRLELQLLGISNLMIFSLGLDEDPIFALLKRLLLIWTPIFFSCPAFSIVCSLVIAIVVQYLQSCSLVDELLYFLMLIVFCYCCEVLRFPPCLLQAFEERSFQFCKKKK